MNKQQKSRFRAASLIQQALLERRRDTASLQLPQRHWADCVRTLSQIKQAAARGWHLAATELQRGLLGQVENCGAYLHQFALEIREIGGARSLPTIGDICRELAALDVEFEVVRFDLAARELSVTTQSIELEGVNLGPFEIRLDWNHLGESPAYRVEALEPNPSNCNEHVTHPHVSGETLCEGDGRRAIRAALDEGRLADFFLLVWRLLDTYAPGRAYVELSDWHGSPCHECGTSLHEDDRCCCCGCDDEFCSDCMSTCPVCDQVFCGSCTTTCPKCGGITCYGCRQACMSCRAELCPDCLSEGKCQSCSPVNTDEDEEAQPPVAAIESAV